MKNNKNKTSWGIITTLKGDAQQTVEFVNYYLNMGANHILLYFDDCDDPAIELFNNHSKITCVPCTNEHWNSLHLLNPTLCQKIQSNMKQGSLMLYDMGIKWATCLDSDELMHVFTDNDIETILLSLPENVGAINVKSYESIITSDQHKNRSFRSLWFRVQPRNQYFINLILYRVLNHNILKVVNDGFFFGHTAGKSFFRTNLVWEFVNHHIPKFVSFDTVYFDSKILGLLHFDSMPYHTWKERWRWRVQRETISTTMGKQRVKQCSMITNAMKKGDKDLKKLYQNWFFVGRIRLFLLHMVRQVECIDISDKMLKKPIHFEK